MNLKIVALLTSIIGISHFFNLSAIIIHAGSIQKESTVCIISDDRMPFFTPKSDPLARQEEFHKKFARDLIYDLARGTKPVDVILEGNAFVAHELRLEKESQKKDNRHTKCGLLSSLILLAQKNKFSLGSVCFAYSDTLGPAFMSVNSFLQSLALEGEILLCPLIKKPLLAKMVEMSIRPRGARPADYDLYLTSDIKPLFFQEGSHFDCGMQSLNKLNGNATVQELFDELMIVLKKVNHMLQQIDSKKHPQLYKIVYDAAKNVIDGTASACTFFEQISGHPIDEIQSQRYLDIIVTALQQKSFAEVIGGLQQWHNKVYKEAYTSLAFYTLMQSMQNQRKALFIGSHQLADFILVAAGYFTQHEHNFVPQNVTLPPSNNQFDTANGEQVKQMLLTIEKMLLDLPALTCRICGLPALQLCSRCNQARYCSTECQKKDWPNHKNVCCAQVLT